MQNQDTELIETSQETDVDPFACLSHQIYVSPFLDLLRTPTGTCGDFVSINDIWYCRLTACRFTWLRSSVNEAIRSNRLSEAFTDALVSLQWIKEIGVQYGCFNLDQVEDHVVALDSFRWWDGLPQWAEQY